MLAEEGAKLALFTNYDETKKRTYDSQIVRAKLKPEHILLLLLLLLFFFLLLLLLLLQLTIYNITVFCLNSLRYIKYKVVILENV